jgi:hypothetical protein
MRRFALFSLALTALVLPVRCVVTMTEPVPVPQPAPPPLPPEARWVDDRLYWDGDIDVWIDVDWWCFVQEIHVVEPRVYRYAVPVGRNVALVRTAKDRTRYVKERDRVVGRGGEIEEVRRAIRKDVPVWRITDVSSPCDARRRAASAPPPRVPEVEAPAPVPVPPVKREPMARPRVAEPDLAAERERLARDHAAERERLERQQAEEARRVREE